MTELWPSRECDTGLHSDCQQCDCTCHPLSDDEWTGKAQYEGNQYTGRYRRSTS